VNSEQWEHRIKQSSHTVLAPDLKPLMSLVPPHALAAVVRLYTVGHRKHLDTGHFWSVLGTTDDIREYEDKAHRHQSQRARGELLDSETKANHLTAAICDLLIALEVELKIERDGETDE